MPYQGSDIAVARPALLRGRPYCWVSVYTIMATLFVGPLSTNCSGWAKAGWCSKVMSFCLLMIILSTLIKLKFPLQWMSFGEHSHEIQIILHFESTLKCPSTYFFPKLNFTNLPILFLTSPQLCTQTTTNGPYIIIRLSFSLILPQYTVDNKIYCSNLHSLGKCFFTIDLCCHPWMS